MQKSYIPNHRVQEISPKIALSGTMQRDSSLFLLLKVAHFKRAKEEEEKRTKLRIGRKEGKIGRTDGRKGFQHCEKLSPSEIFVRSDSDTCLRDVVRKRPFASIDRFYTDSFSNRPRRQACQSNRPAASPSIGQCTYLEGGRDRGLSGNAQERRRPGRKSDSNWIKLQA